jgi:hypothetical protein
VDKRFPIDQLAAKLLEPLAVARQSERDASDEARDSATVAEKLENAWGAQEYSSLARGQAQRAERLLAELYALLASRPKPCRRAAPSSLAPSSRSKTTPPAARSFWPRLAAAWSYPVPAATDSYPWSHPPRQSVAPSSVGATDDRLTECPRRQ